MQSPSDSGQNLIKRKLHRQFLENVNFQIPWKTVLWEQRDWRTDGQIDMKMLIVAFRNFVNAPKNTGAIATQRSSFIVGCSTNLNFYVTSTNNNKNINNNLASSYNINYFMVPCCFSWLCFSSQQLYCADGLSYKTIFTVKFHIARIVQTYTNF